MSGACTGNDGLVVASHHSGRHDRQHVCTGCCTELDVCAVLQLGDEPASMAEAERRRRQACRDGDEKTAARAGVRDASPLAE